MSKRKNLISFLLDRTGSMGAIWESTISGFNEFVQSQVKAEDYKTVWNLTVFDSESIDLVREEVKGKNMEPLSMSDPAIFPRALTPLHDAIAKTIFATDKAAEDYDGVILVILTDGVENASKEYNLARVHDLIRDREDNHNWQVIFLGANMDAYQTGIDYGIQRGQTVTFAATPESVGATYGAAVASSTAYAATGQTISRHTDTTSGTEEERVSK